jgi:hypothetical protein
VARGAGRYKVQTNPVSLAWLVARFLLAPSTPPTPAAPAPADPPRALAPPPSPAPSAASAGTPAGGAGGGSAPGASPAVLAILRAKAFVSRGQATAAIGGVGEAAEAAEAALLAALEARIEAARRAAEGVGELHRAGSLSRFPSFGPRTRSSPDTQAAASPVPPLVNGPCGLANGSHAGCPGGAGAGECKGAEAEGGARPSGANGALPKSGLANGDHATAAGPGSGGGGGGGGGREANGFGRTGSIVSGPGTGGPAGGGATAGGAEVRRLMRALRDVTISRTQRVEEARRVQARAHARSRTHGRAAGCGGLMWPGGGGSGGPSSASACPACLP